VNRTFWPIVNTIVFSVLVPGTVAVLVPRWLIGGFYVPKNALLSWVGIVLIAFGTAVYLRCAWEFAVRGVGTPAPIAPTKFLVTSALHRHVRNPMYIGVALVIMGEAALFRSLRLVLYAAVMLGTAHLFVVFYEEPTLRRQFGKSYEEYFGSVRRWVPKL
jgi:protein-S-isoprenylcysteine O-methyltransferase Ste14